MSDESLTPYERTYGAPLGKQPASPAPGAQQAPASGAPEPTSGPAEAAPAAEAAAAAVPPPPPTSAPTGAAAPKRKAWPWVVLACAVALVLLVGGCASCAVISTIAALDDYPDRHRYDHHDDYDHSFGGYDDDPGYLYDGLDGLSFEGILALTDLDEGSYQGTTFGEGVYRVGDGGLEPGLYYLEGSRSDMGSYLTFDLAAHPGDDEYDLDDSVIYLGNYFTELKQGDVIAFMPPAGSKATMRMATDRPLGVSAPYQSGCYRVGIDIPAGAYVVTFQQAGADAVEAEGGNAGAYVMDDLEFGPDSVVQEAPVVAGSKQTITVEEGQYLELIGAQATPKE